MRYLLSTVWTEQLLKWETASDLLSYISDESMNYERIEFTLLLIKTSMETNEQTNAPDDSEATVETEEELEVLSATRQRIRQLLTDYFAL